MPLFPQVESLRKDIEIFSQNHERDVDRKDAIIQMLDRDLEEVGIAAVTGSRGSERVGLRLVLWFQGFRTLQLLSSPTSLSTGGGAWLLGGVDSHEGHDGVVP